MSARDCYLIVRVNADDLPAEIPRWLLPMVEVLERAREGLLETEQMSSVIVRSSDETRSKFERCQRVLDAFVQEHGQAMKNISAEFALRRGELPAGLARSIGLEIATVLHACTNVEFRALVLGSGLSEWTRIDQGTHRLVFGCLSEACSGQGEMLDRVMAVLVRGETSPTTKDDA